MAVPPYSRTKKTVEKIFSYEHAVLVLYNPGAAALKKV